MPATYHSPRRAAAAANTRAAILDSARDLFVEHGYSAVTVPEIARRARVAVPTVYSSTGGKADILAAILDTMVHTPYVRQTLDRIAATDDAGAVIDAVAAGTRQAHEEHWAVLPRLLEQCRVEPAAGAVLAEAVEEYLRVLGVVTDRLVELGALRPEVDRAMAVDLLWFHLGQGAWMTLVAERGWDFDRAEAWLAASARAALLASP